MWESKAPLDCHNSLDSSCTTLGPCLYWTLSRDLAPERINGLTPDELVQKPTKSLSRAFDTENGCWPCSAPLTLQAPARLRPGARGGQQPQKTIESSTVHVPTKRIAKTTETQLKSSTCPGRNMAKAWPLRRPSDPRPEAEEEADGERRSKRKKKRKQGGGEEKWTSNLEQTKRGVGNWAAPNVTQIETSCKSTVASQLFFGSGRPA